MCQRKKRESAIGAAMITESAHSQYKSLEEPLPTPPTTRSCSVNNADHASHQVHSVSTDAPDYPIPFPSLRRSIQSLRPNQKLDDSAVCILLSRVQHNGHVWSADPLAVTNISRGSVKLARSVQAYGGRHGTNQIILIPHFEESARHWTLYIGETCHAYDLYHYDPLGPSSRSSIPSSVLTYYSFVVGAISKSATDNGPVRLTNLSVNPIIKLLDESIL